MKDPKQFERKLAALRGRIDRADRKLLAALGERMRTVAEIGRLKAEHGQPVLQAARWRTVMGERLKAGKAAGLGATLTLALFEAIHREALAIQRAQARLKANGRKKRRGRK